MDRASFSPKNILEIGSQFLDCVGFPDSQPSLEHSELSFDHTVINPGMAPSTVPLFHLGHPPMIQNPQLYDTGSSFAQSTGDLSVELQSPMTVSNDDDTEPSSPNQLYQHPLQQQARGAVKVD
jgi:hypothetical protein